MRIVEDPMTKKEREMGQLLDRHLENEQNHAEQIPDVWAKPATISAPEQTHCRKEYDAQNHNIFRGYRPSKEIPQLIAAADTYLLPATITRRCAT
jgi:hypothetical protein